MPISNIFSSVIEEGVPLINIGTVLLSRPNIYIKGFVYFRKANIFKQITEGGKRQRGKSKDINGQVLTCIGECLALCPPSAGLGNIAAAVILDHSSPGSR